MKAKRRAAESEFRERALAEARRYGSDSWVFVRELLQNARDAGARRIEWSTEAGDEVEVLRCRDDGSGMSLEHARRYLFALYASSKEEDERQAGRFGVGFWSVLRFRPRRVVIRSRPSGADGWQATLDGDLSSSHLALAAAPRELAAGTEVVLERPRRRRPLAERLAAALQRYGRFLTTRDDPREPLLVLLDGRAINAPFALPAPSASFRQRGWRGVVALGETPRVELFANGLFVREATCLEELLDDSEPSVAAGGNLTLPGSVAPQIYLDSNRLEPLLARSDVRQDRHLRRLLKRAGKELERLIERQLAALRGRPFLGFLGLHGSLHGVLHRGRALWDRLREHRAPGAGLGRRLGITFLAIVALTAAMLAAVGLWPALGRFLPSWPGAGGGSDGRLAASEPGGIGFAERMEGFWGGWPGPGTELPGDGAGLSPRPYADLGEHYLGPRLDPLGAGDTPRLALTYHPPELELYFAALVVEEPGRPPPLPRPTGTYEGPDCAAADECVAVHLEVSPSTAWTRLPVPTGYRLDPRTVRLGTASWTVAASASGEALLEPQTSGGMVRYEVSPFAEPSTETLPGKEILPEPLAEVAARLRTVPQGERVQLALDEVARRVTYDRSLESALRFRDLRRQGAGLLDAALAVGGGDCDIQNGVLVEVLQRSGVVARLAIGWVGRDGGVISGLHAWAEVFEDGHFRVADVSARFALAPAATVTAGRVRIPSSAAGGEPGSHGIRRGWPLLVLGLLLFPIAWLLVRASRNVSRDLRLQDRGDLAGLVAGALEHPGLARLPVLRHGRLLPLIDGGAMSLEVARRRAEAGRLFASAQRGELARRALRRHPVLDATTPEGRVASLGLAAVDLDEWESLLERCRETPLLARLNRYLEERGTVGRPIGRVSRVDDLGRPWVMADLALLYGGERRLLVDGELEETLAAAARERPFLALFRLLDRLAAELDLEPRLHARLLAPMARRLLEEEMENAP